MKKTLSEISKEYNIPKSTLRFYEKNQVLPFLKRDESGYCYVDEADFLTILLVNQLRSAGCSIDRVAEIVKLTERSKTDGEHAGELYREVASILDRQTNELIRKQKEILVQMQFAQYLRWQFTRYALAGTSILPDEEYDGMPPEELIFQPSEEMTDRVLNAYMKKYPNYPGSEDWHHNKP